MLNLLFNLFKKIKDLPEDRQKRLLTYYEEIASEADFEAIVANISSVKDEVAVTSRTRKNTLERIKRFTESAKTPHSFHHKNKDYYTPLLNEGELIMVRFSGLGSEIDQFHFAIVWKAQRKIDPIVIIPTTSFKEESTAENGHSFNIGKISWMSKETVVLLDQLTTISRKRIELKTLSQTRKYNRSKNKQEFAKIDLKQINRIRDGFRVYHLGETTVYQYLLRTERKKLPVLMEYSEQLNHLHRPYIKDTENSTANKFVYALYEDPSRFYTIERHDCIDSSKRDDLLKDWVEAKAEYDDDKKIITKSRDDVRKDAYNAIRKNIFQSEKVIQT